MLVMTDAQLERAARELCRSRGVDPDFHREVEEPEAWKKAAYEIKEFVRMCSAVEEGMRA